MAGKKRTNKKGGNAKKKKTPPSTHQNDATISSSKAASNGGKPVCRFLLEGKCNRGDDCKFLHSPEACAAGARAQCLREGKSEDDAEMAASVAFQVAEKKREMKKNAAASEKQTNDAVSAHPKAGALKDQPPQSEREVEAVNQTKKDEPNKELLKNGKPKQEESNEESSVLPSGLESSMSEFTAAQQEIAKKLCHLPGSKNQRHLFEEWSTSPSDVPKKKAFMEKLESIDKSYPDGGLIGYLTNAVALLEKSKKGENPLEGWVPSVPKGEAFEIGTEEFLETEKLGLEEVGRCGFVLVAGGLGERLGYSGIKIGLPTELATETPYIQFYIETILAFQSRYATPGQKLPLCIMTSGDTNDKTVTLLKANNYFGMTEDQITIVQQGIGVPALYDNDAHIALVDDDPYDIQMKPHGHGDIHALLHSHGVAKTWSGQGIKWTVFFQDTNGLAFHTLALSLGVSSKMGLIMNSITCPRKAKQAIGAITKLSKGDQERTINVEYNQLDPLLRATGYPDGDVNDDTGFSPFPGNINQLLFRLDDYVKVLERTKGVMPEFVNPKYKDAEKTIFKKPTRLECMMQDFPTVLEGLETAKVGFTSLASELCFSPVKNATSDGVALQKGGTHPGVAATGEADQNAAARRILRSIGCNVEEGFDATFSGINVVSGPDCVLKPSFAACSNELKKKFPNPSTIKISGKSSLVLSGDGLVIESLDLDGALIVECEDGASGVIRDLTVKNRGWVKVSDERSDNEVIRMRGYHMNKLETEKIVFKRDGSIEGNYPPKVEAIEPELVTNVPEPVSIAVPVPVKMEELEQKPAPVIEPASVAEPKQAQCLTSKSAEPVSVPEAKPESAISNHVQGTSQKEAPQSIMSSAPVPTLSLEPTPTAMETPTDLSKPASSESNDSDQLCGGCTIL